MTKQSINDQASFSAPIEDLQVRIAFLDDLVEQLNEQVVHQSLEIADLKKQMQLLHLLLPENGEMDLGDQLLDFARKIAKRVVVKRPRHAIYLADQTPDHQWLGDACRFDAYFTKV